MHKTIILLSATLISVTACVNHMTTRWAKAPYATMSFEQAQAECEFEAEKGAPMSDLSKSAFGQAFSQNDIKKKCLKAKGYYQEIVPKTEVEGAAQ